MYVCDQVAGLVHLGQVQFNKVVDYSGDVSEIKVYLAHILDTCLDSLVYHVCMYVCMYVF